MVCTMVTLVTSIKKKGIGEYPIPTAMKCNHLLQVFALILAVYEEVIENILYLFFIDR